MPFIVFLNALPPLSITVPFRSIRPGVLPVTQQSHFDIQTTCDVTRDKWIFQPILVDFFCEKAPGLLFFFLNHFSHATKVNVTYDIDQN